MAARNYPTAFPLKHQQKDMRLAIALGDKLGQALPTSATANELYEQVRRHLEDLEVPSVLFDGVPRLSGSHLAVPGSWKQQWLTIFPKS